MRNCLPVRFALALALLLPAVTAVAREGDEPAVRTALELFRFDGLSQAYLVLEQRFIRE